MACSPTSLEQSTIKKEKKRKQNPCRPRILDLCKDSSEMKTYKNHKERQGNSPALRGSRRPCRAAARRSSMNRHQWLSRGSLGPHPHHTAVGTLTVSWCHGAPVGTLNSTPWPSVTYAAQILSGVPGIRLTHHF